MGGKIAVRIPGGGGGEGGKRYMLYINYYIYSKISGGEGGGECSPVPP